MEGAISNSDKLTGDNLKYQEQSALQLHQDLPKNLKSKESYKRQK